MTMLVTGASGHVGGAVVRRAAARGIPVLAIRHRASGSGDERGVEWASCDLADADAVSRLAAARRVDACIHAAAVSNEAHARPAPLAAIAANVGATANLLEAARIHGWRRLVLVSTGSVFQLRRDTTRPILEDDLPEPANVYSTTKHAAELLVRTYRTTYALSAAAVRISWVYGPPVISEEPTRGPIPYFLLRALRGVAVREGGAEFAASFTFVDDVADGLLAAAQAPTLNHATYHLGPGVNFSAGEVADAVRRAVPGAVLELGPGTEPWTRYTSLRAPLAGERFLADTGFRTGTALADGIAAYAGWMRANPAMWSGTRR
jgi:nucleoside-diphosphate-sugar epimerase